MSEDGGERQRREWEAAEQQRQQDNFVFMMIGATILLAGTGAIGAWGFWGYLNDGVWPTLTLRALFGWSFTHEMIGLQSIVNWLLDLWIGAYTVAVGCLMIFGGNDH